MRALKFLLMVWLVGSSSACHCMKRASAPQPGTQAPQQFQARVRDRLQAGYQIFLPRDYQASSPKRWPLIMFLHGSGERGKDLAKVTVHGPPKLVLTQPDFPFVVVSPQCPNDQVWSDETLLSLLDDVLARYAVDPARVYLTGLSMGGYGTWSLAVRAPSRFAAVAPICGGGETIRLILPGPGQAAALRTLGVWAFHGGKDTVVAPEESERMVSAFKKAGCRDVQLTIYPEAGHDSWSETYKNPKLYEWFLQHERRHREWA